MCALYRPQEKKLYVGWVGDSIATLWKNGTPLCLVNKHVPNRYVCYKLLNIYFYVLMCFNNISKSIIIKKRQYGKMYFL